MNDDTVALNLPVSSVNQILDALADKPYRQTSGLINEIAQQAQTQTNKNNEPAE